VKGNTMATNPIIVAAKDLRQKQTEAEKRLWFKLREKQLAGAKFRRQEPIGKFIVDFVSYEHNLVIEIDGSPHNKPEKQEDDRQRTLWLKSQGFIVSRFWNFAILNHLEKVMKKIEDYIG
jgi:very-short-patch-repair endonuclease